MRVLLTIIILLFVTGCASVSTNRDRAYRVPKKPPPKTQPKPAEETPSQTLKANEFEAEYDEVWSATLAAVDWLKWPPAYVDKNDGTIRLKEAYVYRKSGKLFRAYIWPNRDLLATSNINDYIDRVSYYKPGVGDALFTQENMVIKVDRASETLVSVTINYRIRPYAYSGKIGYESRSKGYIESLLLEEIQRSLKNRPVAIR